MFEFFHLFLHDAFTFCVTIFFTVVIGIAIVGILSEMKDLDK